MNENYVNTTEIFELYVYDNGQRVSADSTPTASAVDLDTDASVSLSAVNTTTHTDGYDYYEVRLDPTEATQTRKVALTWEFVYGGSTYQRTERINVVRPYFFADDLWSHYPEYAPDGERALTIDEVQDVESRIRRIIDSYCRQDFQDYGKKTTRYRGNGTNALQLREHIYKLHKVTTGSLELFSRDSNDDIDVELVEWMEEEPFLIVKKGVDSSYVGLNDRDRFDATVNRTRALFRSGRIYDVEAYHGWKYLPGNVHQAAVILANEVLTHEDRYRQKNITVVRSADYRMEFNQDHNYTTGNVDADKMLAPYVYQGVHIF